MRGGHIARPLLFIIQIKEMINLSDEKDVVKTVPEEAAEASVSVNNKTDEAYQEFLSKTVSKKVAENLPLSALLLIYDHCMSMWEAASSAASFIASAAFSALFFTFFSAFLVFIFYFLVVEIQFFLLTVG